MPFPRYCLLSSHALPFFSLGVWNWLASLAFPHFYYTVHGFRSSLFPSCSSLPFSSLGALLTRLHLRFTTRWDPPFGPSQFLFGLCTLSRSLVFRTPVDLSLFQEYEETCLFTLHDSLQANLFEYIPTFIKTPHHSLVVGASPKWGSPMRVTA